MEPQATPEEELRARLAELTSRYDPERWSGPREEIETDFARLEKTLLEEHKQEMRGFLQGYEQREIKTRTDDVVDRLDQHRRGLRIEQQWGSQNAINQARAGVARDVAANPFFQEAKEEAGRELAYQQAELLTMLYDHEAATLRANGHEPHMEPQPELTRETSLAADQLMRAETGLEEAREAILQEREELALAPARSGQGAGKMTRDAFHALVLAGQEHERENER